MVHEKEELFAGIDTHRDTLAIATCDAFGRILKNAEFKTTKAGISSLIAWLERQGSIAAVGIECTGSYGKGVTTACQRCGINVLEITAPLKKDRRSRGKNDLFDAQSAAQTARDFCYGGSRSLNACVAKDRTSALAELASVKSTYDAAKKMRTQSINELKAAIVNAPNDVREPLRGLTTCMQVKKCAAMHIAASSSTSSASDISLVYVKTVLRGIARRILELEEELKIYKRLLDEFANTYLKHLMELKQIGSISAVQFLLSCGENIERFKDEAAFAKYCGVAPLPASTGLHGRMRLSRAGNRKANSVLYMIAIGRMGKDERTKEYVAKKVSEGKSKKDAIRCLKRYIAREVFAALKQDLKNIKIPS